MLPPDAAHFQMLEEQLLCAEVRRSAVALARLLAEDFIEVGRSGRVYMRDEIISALAAEEPLDGVLIENFKVRVLSAETVLATYVSSRVNAAGAAAVRTLRSSLWLRRGTTWQMAFHQGTPADGP